MSSTLKSINKNIFASWTKRAISKNLISGLNGFFPSNSDIIPGTVTEFSDEPRICSSVVSAVAKFANIYLNGDSGNFGGFGQFQYNSQTGEAIEIVEGTTREAAIILSGKLKAIKKDGDAFLTYQFKEGRDNGVLLITSMIFHLFIHNKNAQLTSGLIQAVKLIKEGICENNLPDFASCCAIISNILFNVANPEISGVSNDVLDFAPLNETGNVLKLTPMTIDKCRPTILKGKFGVFAEDCPENIVVPVDFQKEFKNEFLKERKFSEYEKLLIPKLESWYVMPKAVPEICKLIQKSTGTYKPKRNFMFRGPSSTGKSSMSRAIAATLKMPYVYITCSSDTESSAFLGEPMYDAEGNVKYIESPFIRAIKNGWVVEIQEPYVIAKQGVLTALNGLLDDNSGITLPTGEFVRRHPDSIIIFTTNVSYVGCKKPNQSVLRRMNNVYDIEMPSNKEVKARVIANTGFSNTKLLDKMISVVGKINNYLTEDMIDDGVCGISELIDWASTSQITGDVLAAAQSTIVSKATDDADAQIHILGLLEACFDGNEQVDISDSQIFNM